MNLDKCISTARIPSQRGEPARVRDNYRKVRAANTDSGEAGQAGLPGDDPARGIMILAV